MPPALLMVLLDAAAEKDPRIATGPIEWAYADYGR